MHESPRESARGCADLAGGPAGTYGLRTAGRGACRCAHQFECLRVQTWTRRTELVEVRVSRKPAGPHMAPFLPAQHHTHKHT